MPSTAHLTDVLEHVPMLEDGFGDVTVVPPREVVEDIAAAVAPFIHDRFLDRQRIVKHLTEQAVFPLQDRKTMKLPEALATLTAVEQWWNRRREALAQVAPADTVDAEAMPGDWSRLLELAEAGGVVDVIRGGVVVARLVPAE